MFGDDDDDNDNSRDPPITANDIKKALKAKNKPAKK